MPVALVAGGDLRTSFRCRLRTSQRLSTLPLFYPSDSTLAMVTTGVISILVWATAAIAQLQNPNNVDLGNGVHVPGESSPSSPSSSSSVSEDSLSYCTHHRVNAQDKSPPTCTNLFNLDWPMPAQRE
jgi:hypothetical protein